MKIIENKKDKLVVFISVLFIGLYVIGTVFAGTLLKDDKTTDVLPPAKTTINSVSEVQLSSNPPQPPVDTAVTTPQKTPDKNTQQNNEDDDENDD